MTATPPMRSSERLFSAAVASFDLAGVYLGDRLGWYASLATDGPATPDELAARTGTDARYAREWLEQQAVGGILDVDDDHRFSLPEEHAAVLVDPREPEPDGAAGAHGGRRLRPAPGGGRGVSDGRRDRLGGLRRRHARGPGGIQPPGVHAPARDRVAAGASPTSTPGCASDPPARVVDVGCGEGWSTIAIARAYPNGAGRRHRPRRARRSRRRGGTRARPASPTRSSSATAMPRALETARSTRRSSSRRCTTWRTRCRCCAPSATRWPTGGSLIVVDERVAETFAAPGDDIERFMYGWSITTCLPDGRSRQPSRGDRDRHATGHAARLRARGGLRVGGDPADRERLLPLLPAAPARLARPRSGEGRDEDRGQDDGDEEEHGGDAQLPVGDGGGSGAVRGESSRSLRCMDADRTPAR